MFGLGKKACTFCGQTVAPKQALRARDVRGVVICRGCYEHWERSGRKCAECQTPVHGTQEVSAFLKPRQTFGHADCGGMRFAR